MRLPFVTAALLTTAIALVGCASMDHRSSRAAPKRASADTTSADAYVARVESIARSRGIRVLWVSPPVRRTNSSEDPQ